MELYVHSEADPALDVAVSHALLLGAAGGELPAAVRLWRPQCPALSLGRVDLRTGRSQELLALARQHGATPVRRLAGGRAAVLDGGCLCLGWAQPDAHFGQSSARYRQLIGVIVNALERLGVAARIGQLEGEWCPGAWSVHGLSGKLAGLAQRVIAGGAWCEALIVIERSPASRELGRHVHELLAIPWRAAAQGALAELLAAEADPHRQLTDALLAALAETWPGLSQRPLPATVRQRAVALRDAHSCP